MGRNLFAKLGKLKPVQSTGGQNGKVSAEQAAGVYHTQTSETLKTHNEMLTPKSPFREAVGLQGGDTDAKDIQSFSGAEKYAQDLTNATLFCGTT